MVGGWGGAPLRRRQQHLQPDQRQLPDGAGGGLREPLSLAHRDSVADRGFGRRRQVSGRPRLDQDAGVHGRRDHHQLHGRPSQERPLGPLRRAVPGDRPRCSSRRRTRAPGWTPARATARSRPASAATSPCGGATGCASSRAAAAATARWRSGRARWSTRTWPRVSSPPRRPPSTTARQPSRQRTRWGERKPKICNPSPICC